MDADPGRLQSNGDGQLPVRSCVSPHVLVPQVEREAQLGDSSRSLVKTRHRSGWIMTCSFVAPPGCSRAAAVCVQTSTLLLAQFNINTVCLHIQEASNMQCMSHHASPVLIAPGVMLTSTQVDWPGPRLPADGDAVHSSASLLSSVDAATALQSNRQFTCALTPPRQNTLSSHTAVSLTVCRGGEV